MEDLYQHFRPNEKDYIDLAVDWVRRVSDTYAPYLTSFLDPRQAYILATIVAQYPDLQVSYWGGHPGAERQRGLIYPDYLPTHELSYDIAGFEIDYPHKFNKLSHGQIMGSILGTGIKRDKLGDIISDSGRWQFFIDQGLSDFITIQVDRVGSSPVRLYSLDQSDIIDNQEDWTVDQVIVSSLRLDSFIASCLNLARSKAKSLVDQDRVKLNFGQVDQAGLILEEEDMVSVRGFGRLQFLRAVKQTKKDKVLIEVKKLLHK